MMVFIYSLIGFLLLIGGCVGYIALGAYQVVQRSPKEAMEYCPKHGPLRRRHLLVFVEVDAKYCWLCWHEAMKAASRNGRPHGQAR